MRPVGIAQTGSRVAYRLDCADKIFVATETLDGKLLTHEVDLSEVEGIRRIQQISETKIHTLICGAVSRFTCRMFQHHGLHVIGWVIGDTRLVLERYRNGKLQQGAILYPATHTGPGRHRARRHNEARMHSPNRCGKKRRGNGKR